MILLNQLIQHLCKILVLETLPNILSIFQFTLHIPSHLFQINSTHISIQFTSILQSKLYSQLKVSYYYNFIFL